MFSTKAVESAKLEAMAEQELARRSISGSLFHFALLIITAVTTPLFSEHPGVVLAFGAGLLAAGGFRLMAALRIPGLSPGPCPWRRVFRLSTYLTAMFWGIFAAYVLTLYTGGWPGWFVLLLTTGVAAGASISLAPDRTLSRGYMLTMFGPVVAWNLFIGHLEGYAVSTVVALYLGYLLIQASQQSQRYWEGLQTQSALEQQASELERSSIFLQTLIQESPLALVVINPDQKVRMCNRAFERLFQYSGREISGMHLDSLISDPAQVSEVTTLSERVFRGEVVQAVTRRRKKDGTLADVELCGVPLMIEGQLSGIFAWYRDITNQKKSELSLSIQFGVARILADSPDLAQATPRILESIGAAMGWTTGAMWEPDAGGQFLKCVDTWHAPSAEVAKFLEVTRSWTFSPGQGLPGRVWLMRKPTCVLDIQVDNNFPRAQHARQCGLHGALAFPILSGDELLGVMEFFDQQMHAVDESHVGMLAALGVQIGEFMKRKRAEDVLAQSMRNLDDLRFAMDQHSVVAITDAQGRITHANDRFCAVSKFQREELLGQDHRMLNSGFHSQGFFRDLWTTIARGQVWNGEIKNRAKDGGEYWTDTTIVPFLNANGKPEQYIAIRADITRRKQAEAELQRAKVSAEAASRAKSEFLANMSHEIRTPMNGVIGMTELILDTELDSTQAEYATTIKTSAESLLAIINDILDFSKIEAGKLEMDPIPFRLGDALDNTLKALALRAHSKGLELACKVDSRVPDSLIGDPGRLRQVLTNLLGNAIKFTETGEVILGVALQSQDANGVCLHFHVRDTGLGIPKDKQDRIFEAFSQADASMTRRFGGTGLGLTISSRLVGLMGGRIWVESEPGEGSTFHFIVRMSKGPTDANEMISLDGAALKGLPVLIVDDSAANRTILREILTGWNAIPTEAGDAGQAFTKIQEAVSLGTPFAVILADVQMPGTDGFGLIEKIRNTPGLNASTVILLTSAGQRGDAARCRALNIAAYLTKPVSRGELQRALLQVIGKPAPRARRQLITRHSLREAAGKLTILLAEDNLVNQRLALVLLQKEGHRVEVALDGEAALRKATSSSFDVILMDVQMPGLSGLEVTTRIREQEQQSGRHVPIIAMTAHAMQGDRERCLQAGMDGYVSKPIRRNQLFEEIQRVFALRPSVEQTMEFDEALDMDRIEDRLSGDTELLCELVEILERETPAEVSQLKLAIGLRDARTSERLAHKIKGAASIFGGVRVVDLAQSIETRAASSDWEGLEGLCEEFAMATASLCRALRGHVSKLPAVLIGSVPQAATLASKNEVSL